jgi:3-methyl-2-oxobutanoate hydroxymethyltransferase
MKLNTRKIKKRKILSGENPLSMLTCYDFQTAQLLNESELDMILVGDSVGNVILGYETTVEVTLSDMITFGRAVKRGAPDKFTVVDLPFGTYASLERGIENAINLFQQTKAEALKLEGASEEFCLLIKRCTQVGIPIMGHIGLTPQSVHQQGGYFTHGKSHPDAERLFLEAKALEEAGCFALVLECVTPELATEITKKINIPTIGIGSGRETDGQVLVINDLLKMGPQRPPNFCHPVADFYELKRQGIELFLKDVQNNTSTDQGSSKSLQS